MPVITIAIIFALCYTSLERNMRVLLLWLAGRVRLFLLSVSLWTTNRHFYFTSILTRCKAFFPLGFRPNPTSVGRLTPPLKRFVMDFKINFFSFVFHNLAQRQRRARYVFDFSPWRFAWSPCFLDCADEKKFISIHTSSWCSDYYISTH